MLPVRVPLVVRVVLPSQGATHASHEGVDRSEFVGGTGVREGRVNAEPEEGASPEPEGERPAKKRRVSADPSNKERAKRSKDVTDPKRQLITVEGAGVIEPAAQAPQEASDALPLVIPAPSADGQLVLPSRAELELILAKAETCEDIAGFERMAAACADLARHCEHLKSRLAEFNILRLRSRRRLGIVLMQTDRRGGDRAKWLGATLLEDGLPPGVDPTMGKKCRKLARIPETVVEEYFRVMVGHGLVPSEAGAFRFAAKAAKANGKVPAKPRKAKKPKTESDAMVLSTTLLEVVQRALGQVDVCVGAAKVDCKVSLEPDTFQEKQLRGNVFVSECPYPAEWLPKFAKLRRKTGINEVLVVLPADTSAPWFKDLMESEDEWACCFLTGVQPPILLAHLGPHGRFKATCREVGAIVRSL